MSDLGESLIRGAREALEYAKGKGNAVKHDVLIPAQVDVMAIRKRMNLSRQKFCEEFGFRVRTLEKWERGERVPDTSARAYLTVIASNPTAVIKALHKTN